MRTRYADRGAGGQRRGFAFPYCLRCRGHARRWRFAGAAGALVALSAAAGSVAMASRLGAPDAGVATLVAGALLAVAAMLWLRRSARAACKPSCAHVAHTIACTRRSQRGGVFTFASRRYAAKFALQNARSLVNVDRALRRLLHEYRTPERGLPVASNTQLEWLVKPTRAPSLSECPLVEGPASGEAAKLQDDYRGASGTETTQAAA